jgi:hypothetical protein
LQNFAAAAFTAPHCGQIFVAPAGAAGGVAAAAANDAPHLLQNFGDPGTSAPQFPQIIVYSSSASA